MTTRASTFTYYAPSPGLEGLVAFHYVLSVGAAPFEDIVCALLGQVQLGRSGFAEYRLGGRWTTAGPAALIGPTDHAIRMRAPPGHVAVGCGLTPAGWSRLFRSDCGLANAIMPLTGAEAILSDAGDDVLATVRALDGWLVARLGSAASDLRIAAIDRWVVDGPADDVEALARELGVSRRALERLTRRTHGATPKRLSAKYRSLKIAAELAVGTARDWREVGVASGLSDQSHFIREFTRYVGMTPGAFAADRESFVHRLIAGRWQPGREMSIALWA